MVTIENDGQPIEGTEYHIGDTVRYNESANAGLTGQERVVLDGHGRYVRLGEPLSGAETNAAAQIYSIDLVSCPHTVPEPTAQNLPDHYVPWGPEHPDWDPFFDRAEVEAGRRNYCDQYDAIVEAVGGRPRNRRERLLVTVEIEIEGPRGFTVDARDVTNQALHMHLSGVGVHVTEVTSVQQGTRTPVR